MHWRKGWPGACAYGGNKMIAKFMGNALSTALLAAIIAMPMQAKADDDSRFNSPIVGSAVGTTIAGIGSAGAAWVVKRGRARLESDGALKIEVTGLLLAATGTTGTVQAVAASVACGDMVGLGASTDPYRSRRQELAKFAPW